MGMESIPGSACVFCPSASMTVPVWLSIEKVKYGLHESEIRRMR